VYFKATVAGVPATCLMSSCCTNTLMSASCARQMGITVEPCVGESLQAAVANGALLLGFSRYSSRCSSFLPIQSVMLLSLLMPIKSVSVIFLCKYFATLFCGHKCCVLVFGPESKLDEPVQYVLGGYAARMSAVWTGKGLANGCHTFLAVCTDVQTSQTPLMHLVLQ